MDKIEKQLAQFILGMIGRSVMPCDDATQTNIATSKQWLKAIVDGHLTVSPAQTPAAVAP